MKKILCFILAFMLVMSNAYAEGCIVVSGTGKNIGDEIKCGTEYFYVLSNDGSNIKVLSKYNLNTGITIYKEVSSETYSEYSTYENEFVNKILNEKKYYDVLDDLYSNESEYYYGTLFYNIIDGEIYQNEKAIGAHGDVKGSPVFPEVGVIRSDPSEIPSYQESKYFSYGGGGYNDFEYPNASEISGILKQYNLNLYKIGVKASSVTIPTVKDINSWVYDITGEELPLKNWYEKEPERVEDDVNRDYYIIGSIKERLNGKNEWIYSTTYWTRTIGEYDTEQYFVDTLGNLCNGNDCGVALGAGIRPIVTLDVNNMIYNITKEVKGKGEVVVNKNAKPGEEVEFSVTPAEGYTVKEVTIIDEYGNIIIPDGNKFIMPSGDVKIIAEFVPKTVENPKMGISNIIGIGILGVLAITLIYIIFRRYTRFGNLN